MSRPVGSTESVQRIFTTEMLALAKTARKAREMIDWQLDEFRKELQGGALTLDGQLKVMEALKDALLMTTTVIERGTKVTAEPQTAQSIEDPESVMKELLD